MSPTQGVVPTYSGQTSNAGTVSEQVTDESSAVVPGATVKMTDTATNALQTDLSNAHGRYVFTPVPVGTYNISFTKTGFASYAANSRAVEIMQVLTINAKLNVVSTATTVEVTTARARNRRP